MRCDTYRDIIWIVIGLGGLSAAAAFATGEACSRTLTPRQFSMGSLRETDETER